MCEWPPVAAGCSAGRAAACPELEARPPAGVAGLPLGTAGLGGPPRGWGCRPLLGAVRALARPLGLVCPVTTAEAPGRGWMSCDQRPGGRGATQMDVPAPQAAGWGGGGREAEPTQETRCGWGGSLPQSPREHGSTSLLQCRALSPSPEEGAGTRQRFQSGSSVCTERAHSGQRWVGSGSERPESGHGGALPCSPLRRQERGPHAPTESSLGTRCPQRVRTGLGTRGYGATPRGGLQGTWRAPWGFSDAAPTPLGGGSGRPLPPCAPEDLQLHPAGAAQSADTCARVCAGELPRHGRAPRHPARRRARRPRPPGQVGPRLPPGTPDPPTGTLLSPWIGLLHCPCPSPGHPPPAAGPGPSWRLTRAGSRLSTPSVRQGCRPGPWASMGGVHGEAVQGQTAPAAWSWRPPEGALPSRAT